MKKTVCALGFFDGVHRAHSLILSRCAAYAKERSLTSAAVTFDRSPSEFFGSEVRYITTFEQKKRLISALGIEKIVPLRAEGDILSLTPEEFVEKILVSELHASAVFCGFNYSFGKGGSGNAEKLVTLCRRHGIEVFVSEKLSLGSLTVSSSEIRASLAGGDIETANLLLGYPFSVCGKVEEGKRLGGTIGFPTVNIYPPSSFVRLPHGVYVTKAKFNGRQMPSVTNVGTNPTVGDLNLRIETHIMHFDGDLYGKEISVDFYKFLRGEKKFASVEALRGQIAADRNEAENFFARYNTDKSTTAPV